MASETGLTLDAQLTELQAWLPTRSILLQTQVRASDVDALSPQEWSAIRQAIPSRQAEFASGRRLFRRAATAVGLPGMSLPMRADRSPAWPEGWRGSLSHAKNQVVLGLAEAAADFDLGFGLDLEPVQVQVEEELWPSLFTARELLNMTPERARRGFSLKEAVFKAMLPFGNQGLDFLAVELDWPSEFAPQLRPLPDASRRLPAGSQTSWHAWCTESDDWLLAAVWILSRPGARA